MTSQSSGEPGVRSSETLLILDQLRRAYYGPAWHGPALKPVLADVAEVQAKVHATEKAHSIWEISLHIAAWLRIARERLTATSVFPVTPEQDWPTPNGTWQDALAELDGQQQALERAVELFPAGKLHEMAPAQEPQTYYVLLHGVIQHTLYHTGQIVLLAKQSGLPR